MNPNSMAANDQISPWFKIFALMVVGGVAKALFAPQWRPISPAVVQGIRDGVERGFAEKTVDTLKDV